MNKFFKKSTALISTAIIASASLSTGVLAADSYSQLAEQTIDKNAQEFSAAWDEELSQTSSSTAAAATYTISIGDLGVTYASLFDLDLSWFQDIKLLQNVKFDNGSMYEKFEVTINDGSIITLDCFMDIANNMIYMSVPELADGYLMVDLSTVEDADLDLSEIDFDALFEYASNPGAYLPSGAELAELISKYGKLIVGGMTDQGAGTDTTITAGSISQNVKAYSADTDYQGLIAMIDAIAETASSDETLQNIIQKFVPMVDEDGDTAVTELQDALTELREELAETDTDSTSVSVTSTLYADEEDNVVGKAYDMNIDGDTVAISVLYPTDGTTTGLDASVTVDGAAFSITGEGVISDGYVTGDYVLSADDVAILNIHLENAGEDSGNISLSIAEDVASETIEDEELATYAAMAAGFSIDLGYSSLDDAGSTSVTLGISSSGSNLISLQMDTLADDSLEVPSVESFSPIYDMNDDTDVSSYLAGADFETIYNNAVSAGVPDSFIEQLISLFSGSDESEYEDYDYDDAEEDSYEIEDTDEAYAE